MHDAGAQTRRDRAKLAMRSLGIRSEDVRKVFGMTHSTFSTALVQAKNRAFVEKLAELLGVSAEFLDDGEGDGTPSGEAQAFWAQEKAGGEAGRHPPRVRDPRDIEKIQHLEDQVAALQRRFERMEDEMAGLRARVARGCGK